MEGENDILIRLYDMRVDELEELTKTLAASGVIIKQAMAVNTDEILDFVKANFPSCWAGEVLFALMHRGCFIAVRGTKPVGFCCFGATAPDFLGPAGVIETERGQGIVRVLVYRALLAMKSRGFKYAIAGMARPAMAANLARNFDVVEIPHSIGSYEDMLDTSIV